jgi:molybdopterin-binding protein
MNFSVKTTFGIIVLLLLSVALFSAEAGNPVPASYSTQVTVEPVSGGFALKAQVKDISSGQVVAGAMLKLPSGEAGDTETTLETGERVVLSATIDGSSKTANYSVTIKSGETLLSEHSARVAL